MKHKHLWRGIAAIAIFVICLLLCVTQSMFVNAGFINTYLEVETYKLVPKDLPEGVEPEMPIHFKSDFAADPNNVTDAEKQKQKDAVAAFVEKEAEEGAVLFKNDNNALPLSPTEITKVSLFGRSTVNPYKKATSGGGGSGPKSVDYLTALSERGFTYNQTLVDAYNADTSPKRNGVSRTIGESPVSVYTEAVKNSFAGTDVAIVMLSREGGESNDLYKQTSEGISQLALDKNERDMLEIVKTYKNNGTFKKVIVLLNSGHPMEVDWLDDYGVDACMLIGGVGSSTGFYGVADLLKGAVVPSGRTVDTYATDSLSAPATVNFGEFAYTNSSDVAKLKDDIAQTQYYVFQAEGIYVGYKYYETRYEDCVLGQGNASANVGVWASKGSGWNYADEVSYPFGYGLSYTSFTQSMDEVKDNGDGTMTVKGVVKNTGNYDGKSVVELYAQTPYGEYEKTNNVEKSAVQLVGFTKTDVIEKGKEAPYEITFDKYFLASYDYTNAKTYIMSEGAYYLAVGDDAHDALNNILAKKGKTGLVDIDGKSVTGDVKKAYTWNEKFDDKTYSVTDYAKVTNRMDDADINSYLTGGNKLKYMSRKAWDTTYPTKAAEITASAELLKLLDGYTYSKPAGAPSQYDIKSGIDAGIKLADMFGVPYNDPLWETFISQMSVIEMVDALSENGGVPAIKSINSPSTKNGDGPDGIANGNGYVNESLAAASWSTEMLRERGRLMGEDSLLTKGKQQVWCPGINTHRTPFGGRNFEYYSEDANLAYLLSAGQVEEMEKRGVSVGPKHFFANDQETWRTGVATYGNEQGFREIQLRAFEGAFVKGRCTSVMTAFNRLGPVYAGAHKGTMIDLLRGEWGFLGINITDAAGSNTYIHSIESIVYGTDMFCYTSSGVRSPEIVAAIKKNDDGYLLQCIKDANRRIWYTYAHTNLMNGLSSDFDVVPIMPWWQYVVIGIDIGFGVIALGALAMYVLSAYVFKKKGEVR